MSAPAAKALVPAPRTMTQRNSSFAESSCIRSPSSVHEASEKALSLSGRSSTTVAIAPSRSTRTAAVMTSLIEEVDESHADEGYIGDQDQHRQQHGDEVHVDFAHFPHVGLGDRAAGHQHARHRRGLLADAEVDRDDQAEMDRIDADRGDQRHDD